LLLFKANGKDQGQEKQFYNMRERLRKKSSENKFDKFRSAKKDLCDKYVTQCMQSNVD
jgi:hypothetical protein